MFTQKVLWDLLLHYLLGQQDSSSVMLLHWLNDVSERLDSIEALLEKRQETETRQFKEVKTAMLTKVAAQLNHLEKSHLATIADLTAEVKAVRQSLESTKSKFIGFE